MRTRAMVRPYLPVACALLLASACNAPSAPPPAASASPRPSPAPPGASAAPAPGSGAAASGAAPIGDLLATPAGDVRITPIHHGSLRLDLGGKTVYVDPTAEGKVEGMPKADLVFVTDIHADHFDPAGLDAVKKASTVVVAPRVVAEKLPGATVMSNGESRAFDALEVTAVPMYNKQRGPAVGKLFHDKGRGNGYVFAFGGKRLYVSGDTECTDEMRALQGIDVAFVCMNLPYTMPPAEAAECVKAFRPKVVYPYHYRSSDLTELTSALAAEKGIEVRLRAWY